MLVIAEEYGDWTEGRRRIDLLAVDTEANLVVIELKRTETGGHMELQAIRYAAIVSTMRFAKAVAVFQAYLDRTQRGDNARVVLLDFLGWDEPQEDAFGTDVRIVLASAEFSKELTTSVLWLKLTQVRAARGGSHDPRRFFTADDELIQFGGCTYALSNQWGGEGVFAALGAIAEAHPELQIEWSQTVSSEAP